MSRRLGLCLVACALTAAHADEAHAAFGQCRLVAPTTPGVLVVVSDVDRAAQWYREHAGLIETARRVDPSLNNAVSVDMERGRAGVTLIESSGFAPSVQRQQMVCLVLDGPPAPPADGETRYLTDPDGTGVELPPLSGAREPER